MYPSYTKENTHIKNSYLSTNIEADCEYIIIRGRHARYLPITRTLKSYIREWKGHNRLYKLHLFRSHTRDVDLNENNSKFEELIWFVLGSF